MYLYNSFIGCFEITSIADSKETPEKVSFVGISADNFLQYSFFSAKLLYVTIILIFLFFSNFWIPLRIQSLLLSDNSLNASIIKIKGVVGKPEIARNN